MKVLEFKTLSPLFEMERDGEKPFTFRKWDGKDERFRAISQFDNYRAVQFWVIRIVNPDSGEWFARRLLSWNYVRRGRWGLVHPQWIILHLGERMDNFI